ncbi:MAG: energy-coupling factor ABC transporter permease [Eubacteriales bacterium]|nr:energy-coupling factor ABC transporter permease [Eubacteriales bacterium]MDD3072904.1 energy-coupling factor ABC transporter permease [Eubacteriales bacterium]MDD4079366.1 energy-coupling factor ABC transporter permease [Eubacteriales bacterium]MDD4769289.1 energy-coupling factor ABC transporter permease [Eubacteriales bacterium]
MSHLHISDGVLPWWLWIGGFVAALAIVLLALFRLQARRRQLPAVAVMAAVALAAMNIPLGLPVHINLAALAGIVLGPLNGFLAMFIVNLINALIGHGAMTVLGINSLLVGSEALVAGLLFKGLGGAKRLLPNSALSVLVALLVSTLLVVAVVGAAGQELEALVAHGHTHDLPVGAEHDHESGFLKTFVTILAPLMAVWMAAELTVSLLVTAYVNKVKGGWFARG